MVRVDFTSEKTTSSTLTPPPVIALRASVELPTMPISRISVTRSTSQAEYSYTMTSSSRGRAPPEIVLSKYSSAFSTNTAGW